MKCLQCGKYLINFGGMLWLHPPFSCQSSDGLEIKVLDSFLVKKFKEKYGRPVTDSDKILNSLSFKLFYKLEEVLQSVKEKLLIFSKKKKKDSLAKNSAKKVDTTDKVSTDA